MRISDRLKKLKPSATLAVNAKAQELKAQGREVVSLAVGEPDFGTPEHVREAAKKAIDDGFTRYTPVPGIPDLRNAIAGYYGQFYGVCAKGENTIASTGGKQALYNLLMALLNPGDEVLIPAPYWVSYPAMVELADGVPVIVPTGPENGFLVSVRDLEAMCTPRTSVLILNSPSNPTGGHYAQEAMDEIARWAKARGVFIISDEVYDRLVYEPAKPSTLSGFWQRHPENVAVVGALSKSFCMTGWRMGWTLAHPDLVKACGKIQGQSTSNINSITQKAAIAALTGPWTLVDEMKTAFVRRRDLALSVIRSWPGVTCPKPDGAFYLFPVVDSYYTPEMPDSAAMCTRLLEEAGVALVPGSAFGDDRCVRFSYAVADEVLMTALSKVGKVLLGK
ncbi:MAG: pyridoxal phosphate-dependent aminotransferase [Humidesulfovibrio sp.]|jgi:aspartate aminotransferase|uniref:pyridoxal phosphate-dependent aminotransferase n=1 Tax=Humidesulfovibrio sp. TaxID=2910988 RepID=UPI0027360953|nr:pyridoxal phosphate-dependent aminotransferase [Humidesulfovibrio sp.]MDP2848795.1 pyridoxal phosphate-dependent aminotransferase [Humidesulfovibrio sp.]